jgi:hypothetical protein
MSDETPKGRNWLETAAATVKDMAAAILKPEPPPKGPMSAEYLACSREFAANGDQYAKAWLETHGERDTDERRAARLDVPQPAQQEIERFEPYDWHEGDYLPSERERADMLDTLRSQEPDTSIQAVMQEEYDEFHYTPVEGPVSEAMHILWKSNIHGERFPETFREALATLDQGAERKAAPEPQPADAKLYTQLASDNETRSPPLPAQQAIALLATYASYIIAEQDSPQSDLSEMGADKVGLYAPGGDFIESGADYRELAERLVVRGDLDIYQTEPTPQTAEERLAAREAAYQAERAANGNEQPSQGVEQPSNVVPFERD